MTTLATASGFFVFASLVTALFVVGLALFWLSRGED